MIIDNIRIDLAKLQDEITYLREELIKSREERIAMTDKKLHCDEHLKELQAENARLRRLLASMGVEA